MKAGYHRNRKNAGRLKANEDIQHRVAELQFAAAKRTRTTVETICDELEAVRIGAMNAGQFAAAANAVMGKAPQER